MSKSYQNTFDNLIVVFVIASVITAYSQDCNTAKLKHRIEKLERQQNDR